MATRTDNLLDWLRDAHAMEQQAEQMLSAQARRLEHYPQLKARIEQHQQETVGQREALALRLEQLGSAHSVLKDLGGRLLAFSQALGGAVMSDEVVKGAISGYVFEHLEIATYQVIIAAARSAGDTQTEQLAERILAQEQAMAQWMLEHLPHLTENYLARSEAPDTQADR